VIQNLFPLSSSFSASFFWLPNVPERWRERKRKWMEKVQICLLNAARITYLKRKKLFKGMADLFLLPLLFHPEMRRIPVNRCCWWVWRISIVESFHHTKQKGKAIVDIMYTQ
jgi:hypothetical protein